MNVRQRLLVAIVFAICVGQGHQASALPESVALADAAAVDQALLMSESFALGMRNSIQKRLRSRSDRANVDSCMKIRIDRSVSTFFESMISSAIPPDDLRYGAVLARNPVFVKLNTYIRANKEALRAAVTAGNVRMDHYFLLAAAQRLNIPTDELRQVNEFVSWHRSVSPALNSAFKIKLPELLTTTNAVVSECITAAAH